MEFVVIVLGVVLMRHLKAAAVVQRDGWFDRWLAVLKKALGSGWPWVLLIISIAVPATVIFLVDGLIAERWYGLAWFAFNLLVFLYALGRGNLNTEIEACLVDLDRNDLQAAYHDAAAFNINHHPGLADSEAALHREMLTSISYGYFQRYYAVIFWYVLLGAGGALLYRLTLLYRARSLDHQSLYRVAERWLGLLDWLPLRLSGLMLAIVGNFTRCFELWLARLFNRENNAAEMMGFYVGAALDIQLEEDEDDDGDAPCFADEVRSLRRLLNRALIGLGVVLALAVLMT